MTIEVREDIFPNNVVKLIADTAPLAIDSSLIIYKRPLRYSDGQQVFGVSPALWTPEEYEFQGQNPAEPTLQRYTIMVQALILDADEEEGLNLHSVFAYEVRKMLYRDPGFRTAMRSMVAVDTDVPGATERLFRWQIRKAQYLNNEIDKQFFFLSTTEVVVDTQVTPS